MFCNFQRTASLACLIVLAALAAAGCDTEPTPKPVRVPAITDLPQSEYISTTERDLASLSAPTPVPHVVYDPLIVPMTPAIQPFEQWTEQQAAADALGRIGAPAVPQLIDALRNRDPEVRKQAAEVLARMGADARAAVPDLVRLLDDEDLAIRKTAARTLGRIGPDAAEAVPALMRNLLQPEPQPPSAAAQN